MCEVARQRVLHGMHEHDGRTINVDVEVAHDLLALEQVSHPISIPCRSLGHHCVASCSGHTYALPHGPTAESLLSELK